MLFAKSTCGFYDDKIHGTAIPSDAVEITFNEYEDLLTGQSSGKIIASDAEGRPVLSNPPAPTNDQIISELTSAVQSHLDTAAQALGYDDLKTAVGYADESAVVKFQEEGKALRAWRSLVWASCIATMQLVEEGQAPVPTAAALIASLPAFSL